jgi:hypothetical protein
VKASKSYPASKGKTEIKLKPDLRREHIAPKDSTNPEVPELFSNLESSIFEDNDIPFSQLSHAEQQKLVKFCIAIVNEVNTQHYSRLKHRYNTVSAL